MSANIAVTGRAVPASKSFMQKYLKPQLVNKRGEKMFACPKCQKVFGLGEQVKVTCPYCRESFVAAAPKPEAQIPTAQQQIPAQYLCRLCSQPMKYIKEYNSWYCDSCRKYAGEMPTYPCTNCGRPLRYVPQYQRWFCDTCQTYA